MNSSFLKITSLILAGLFLLAVIPWMSDAFAPKKGGSISDAAISVNLSSFTENSVMSVSMKQKDKDAVALEKKGDVWKIGTDDADTGKVTSLFQSFATLTPREMVSKNEDNFSKFGVTKDDGIRLEIRDTSGGSSVFYIGIASDVPQEFFIRKDGIKNAYSVSGNLRDLLTKDASYWKKAPEEKSATTTPSTSSSKEMVK
ncbi:MAG: DUF4340 domain-containing protein [Candidatus Moraniibacteriota bacterium]|nr:MAG: DUF4340 domain-containing protein [Candidatus Moranbacteria bacterium]